MAMLWLSLGARVRDWIRLFGGRARREYLNSSSSLSVDEQKVLIHGLLVYASQPWL